MQFCTVFIGEPTCIAFNCCTCTCIRTTRTADAVKVSTLKCRTPSVSKEISRTRVHASLLLFTFFFFHPPSHVSRGLNHRLMLHDERTCVRTRCTGGLHHVRSPLDVDVGWRLVNSSVKRTPLNKSNTFKFNQVYTIRNWCILKTFSI